jgi:hypothetical protein
MLSHTTPYFRVPSGRFPAGSRKSSQLSLVLVNKTNRCTVFQFYWYYDSTCFGQPFWPSSGVLSRTSALVHFMQLWWPFATRSRMDLHPTPGSKLKYVKPRYSFTVSSPQFVAVYREWRHIDVGALSGYYYILIFVAMVYWVTLRRFQQ